MFGLFGKKKHSLVDSGILSGATAIHSHLLPGVDDGSPDLNHSLDLLSYMESLGYQELWITPHSMEDLQNTAESLQEGFQALLKAYQGPLKLHISSE